jgi:hypothetical protein
MYEYRYAVAALPGAFCRGYRSEQTRGKAVADGCGWREGYRQIVRQTVSSDWLSDCPSDCPSDCASDGASDGTTELAVSLAPSMGYILAMTQNKHDTQAVASPRRSRTQSAHELPSTTISTLVPRCHIPLLLHLATTPHQLVVHRCARRPLCPSQSLPLCILTAPCWSPACSHLSLRPLPACPTRSLLLKPFDLHSPLPPDSQCSLARLPPHR